MVINMDTDDATLLEFLKRLARATEYKGCCISGVIGVYWKDEAQAWLARIEDEAKAEALAVLSQNEPKVL